MPKMIRNSQIKAVNRPNARIRMSFLRDKANPMQECILANNHCQHLTNLDHVKPNIDDLVEVWVLIDGCMGFIEDNHAMQILHARRERVEGNVRCSYC